MGYFSDNPKSGLMVSNCNLSENRVTVGYGGEDVNYCYEFYQDRKGSYSSVKKDYMSARKNE